MVFLYILMCLWFPVGESSEDVGWLKHLGDSVGGGMWCNSPLSPV